MEVFVFDLVPLHQYPMVLVMSTPIKMLFILHCMYDSVYYSRQQLYKLVMVKGTPHGGRFMLNLLGYIKPRT